MTSHTSSPPLPPHPPSTSYSSVPDVCGGEVTYRARKAYFPNHAGELTLNVGDVITSVKQLGNDWCLGRNESIETADGVVSVGIFPASYISLSPLPPRLGKGPGHDGDKAARSELTGGEGTTPAYAVPTSAKEGKRRKGELSRKDGSSTVPSSERRPITEEDDEDIDEESKRTDREIPSSSFLAANCQRHVDMTSCDVEYNSLPTPKRGRFLTQKPHLIVKPNRDKGAAGSPVGAGGGGDEATLSSDNLPSTSTSVRVNDDTTQPCRLGESLCNINRWPASHPPQRGRDFRDEKGERLPAAGEKGTTRGYGEPPPNTSPSRGVESGTGAGVSRVPYPTPAGSGWPPDRNHRPPRSFSPLLELSESCPVHGEGRRGEARGVEEPEWEGSGGEAHRPCDVHRVGRHDDDCPPPPPPRLPERHVANAYMNERQTISSSGFCDPLRSPTAPGELWRHQTTNPRNYRTKQALLEERFRLAGQPRAKELQREDGDENDSNMHTAPNGDCSSAWCHHEQGAKPPYFRSFSATSLHGPHTDKDPATSTYCGHPNHHHPLPHITLKHRPATLPASRNQRVADSSSGYRGGGSGGMGAMGAPPSSPNGSVPVYCSNSRLSTRLEVADGKARRFLACVVSSLVVGLLVFVWMVLHLDYDLTLSLMTSGLIALVLCCVLLVSRLVRCVAALLLPSLATSRGHISFAIFLCGYLLTGPISNVYLNMEEVSRSMSCSAEQSYNQTMILLKPFDEMMLHLNRTALSLQDAAHNVTEQMRPLEEGLGSIEMDVYNGRTQLLGTKRTCKALIERAYNACDVGMHRAQDQCLGVMGALGNVYHHARDVLDRINPDRWASKQQQQLKKRQIERTSGVQQQPQQHVIASSSGGSSSSSSSTSSSSASADELQLSRDNNNICEPLNTTQVCYALNDSESLCQPSKWAGEAIQEAINATQAAVHSLHGALQFYVSTEPYNVSRQNASALVLNIRHRVEEEFRHRTWMFSFVVEILTKLIPLALLLLIRVAYLHVKYYMCHDTYDNIYVGRQLAALDIKRAEVTGEPRLLPLKNYEHRYLIDSSRSELSYCERDMYRSGACVVILSLLISFTCYTFDYVLYWVLAVVERQGAPIDQIPGRAGEAGTDRLTSLDLVVTGEGIIVELLQVFLKGFHPTNGVFLGTGVDSAQAYSSACLPSPSTPSLINLFVLVLLYCVFVMVVLLKAYIFRIRNRIVAFFYDDRNRARTVHLYRVLLAQRQRLPSLLHQLVRTNYRRVQLAGIVSCKRQLWLRCCSSAGRAWRRGAARDGPTRRLSICLVCQCRVGGGASFRDCETERCPGLYCADCFEDLLHVCPLCVYVPVASGLISSAGGSTMECALDDEEEEEGEEEEDGEYEGLEAYTASSRAYL